jgi:isopentenyl diphosphate isomerase/L-lactate dehydrogenase-like FMN-dependent dehydrogenase
VVKIIKILEREVGQGMRLLGAATVNDLIPELVGYLYLALIPHD